MTKTDEWFFVENRLEETPLPSTLTGVLQARLDKLTVWEKKILQQASVIGREFWDKTLENFGDDVSVTAVLESLRSKELLYRHETSAFGEATEYLFKHALLRDVVYETVLLDERRDWHEKTAEWLIEASGERAVEYAATIAAHFEKAQKIRRSAEWFGRAGEQSFKTHAAEPATDYYQKALNFAEKTNEEIPRQRILDWQRGLELALWSQAKFDEAIDVNRQALENAEIMNDKAAQSGIWYRLSTCQLEKGENRASSEIMILTNMGGAIVLTGDYEKVERHLQNVIEMIGGGNHFSLAEACYFLAQAFLGQEKTAAALAAAKRSFELSEKSEQQEAMGQAWHILGLISANLEQKISLKEDSFDARQCFQNSLRIFAEIKSKVHRAQTLRSFADYENTQGNSHSAHKMLNEAREIFTRLEMPLKLGRTHF